MYNFTGIPECINAIVTKCNSTVLETRIDKAALIVPKTNVVVTGPVRGVSGSMETLPLSLKVDIVAQASDPMDLKQPEWGNYTWKVSIKFNQYRQPKSDGNCFFMQLFIPQNLEGVVVSWLNQIMINPTDHTQVKPAQCFEKNTLLPDFQWGTLFMNLFEAFNNAMVPVLGLPIVGGLVDDAFVQYCNKPVVFSDFRRMLGLDPWYESFGFYMANQLEYEYAIENNNTYIKARESVLVNFAEYKAELETCFESETSAQELAMACNTIDCSNLCATGQCDPILHHREMAKYIGQQIKNNVLNACEWISDKPPVSSCLTAFNRHFNKQTMHLRDDTTQKIYDYVVRLKFYS